MDIKSYNLIKVKENLARRARFELTLADSKSADLPLVYLRNIGQDE